VTRFDYEPYGLSNDPTIRFGQLSGGGSPAAIIWATRGERALQDYLASRR
jgi:hypothetical protein